MATPATILADSNPIVSAIVVLLLLGLSLVVQWLKARHERQKQEALLTGRPAGKPKTRQAAFQQGDERRPAPPPDEIDDDLLFTEAAPPPGRAAPPPGTSMQDRPSGPPAEPRGRAVRRSPYQQTTRRTFGAPPPPPPPPAPEPEAARVADELRHEQERLRREELERRRRLAARRSPEADTRAIEGRLVHVRPKTAPVAAPAIGAEQPGLDRPAGIQVNLSDPAEARRAIVFHEIFAEPKALRRAPEMWDA